MFWTMTSLDVSMLIRVVRPYVKLLLQLPVMVRKIMYNRTAAVVVGSLLYTIRGTLWVALLRGKWVGWAWSRLQRRRQLRNFEESNFDNRAQAALYIPRQFVNGSPHRVAKRTLFEDSLVNLLYGNMPAANAMRRATRRCTQAMPFLTQHVGRNTAHPLLNAVLNRLSSLAALQHLKAENVIRDWGEVGAEKRAGIEPVWFVFAVIGYSPSNGFRVASAEASSLDDTNSREVGNTEMQKQKNSPVIDRRSSKVRVVVVREDRLQSLRKLSCRSQQSYLTQPHSERHAFRSEILLRMKSLYEEQLLNEDCMAPRHLLRVQMGYRRVDTLQPHNDVKKYKNALLSPHLLGTRVSKGEDGDTPKMFTPRR